MITQMPLPDDVPSARSIPRVFSDYTRCHACRGQGLIRVHYDPGCPLARGEHFHRLCPCGAEWLERSAGHAPVTISLDDPRYVPICQQCRERHTHLSSMQPTCCLRPEVSYHDVTDPCEICTDAREPGMEG